MAKPIKQEVERIQTLLKGELTNKQKFALMIELKTLEWIHTIRKGNVPEPPSVAIMKSGAPPE